MRSKISTLASTAMPRVRTRPAMPGIVMTGSCMEPPPPMDGSCANTPRKLATSTSAVGRSAMSRKSATSATRPAPQ